MQFKIEYPSMHKLFTFIMGLPPGVLMIMVKPINSTPTKGFWEEKNK